MLMKTTSLAARAVLTVTLLQFAAGTQIAAAQSAPTVPVPANSQTTIGHSANGTPVVEIATPNSAGVSHNFFSSYNVGSGGLILNNSSVSAVSLLGGGTPANANLANHAPAGLILNEVATPNAGSMLAGYQEILGPSAELVLANPWGITCNGCGFLNTPRVTLTTGTPTLNATGALAGFTITGGDIAVTGNGLDATRQNVLDLLARSISISGNIQVGSQANSVDGDLQLIAGASQFDYASRTATAIAGSGPAPQFAIDSSALGGMYANRIRLVVTEQGAGVRLLGGVAALADDLTISADGQIELRGAASAANDLDITGTDIDVQLAGSNTFLYGDRDLNITASGTLDLGTGSIGAQRNLTLTSATLTDMGGANDLRFAGSNGVLQVNTTGAFDAAGGYWEAPQLSINAGSISIGSDATLTATGALSATVTAGTTGGLDNSGTIAGGSVSVVVPGTLANKGTLSGDTVTLTATDVSNTQFIQATTGLDLSSNSLENNGKDAVINASNDPTGAVTFHTGFVTNSGTIWSAGDLNLDPISIVQQRDPTATSNPLIGAGRDLTIAYAGVAGLAAGDLQAGRDLTITASSITDLGAIGSTGDLRYAGRNLIVTAAPGGSIDIAGGTWYSGADMRLTGEDLVIGSYFNQQLGTTIGVPNVQLLGAQGGSGTVALEARSGTVQIGDNGAVFSGGDLSLTQPNSFVLPPGSELRAAGTLTVDAADLIQNFGTIAGDNVVLAASTATPLFYRNEDTGVLSGQAGIQIGTAANPAGTVLVAAAQSGTNAGIFGGVLNIDAGTIANNGTIQAVGGGTSGAGSTLNATMFTNNGTLLGFADSSGGGVTINAQSLGNAGLLYDSSSLQVSANSIENQAAGTIASANLLQISTDIQAGPAPVTLDNQGSIWANTLIMTLGAGLQNGRDPGLPNYVAVPGNIYAASYGEIDANHASNVVNNGTIHSGGDFRILGTGGTFSNVISQIPATEVTLTTTAPVGTMVSNDLGFLTVNPKTGNSPGTASFQFNGTTYYVFNETDPATEVTAYLDTSIEFPANQQLSPGTSSLRPTVTANGNLTVANFQSVANNGGSIGAGGTVNILSDIQGASLTNNSLNLYAGTEFTNNQTAQYTCMSGFGNPVACGTPLVASLQFDRNVTVPATSFQSNGTVAGTLPGLIYGQTVNISVAHGTITNAGPQVPLAPPVHNSPSQTPVSVTAPGTGPNSRGGATLLNIGNAQIPLPTSANGIFVTNPSPGKGPLIETNPLFGIDSPALGSAYLVSQLGLNPDQQARDIGDNNYESYLIQQQVQASTGQSVLTGYGSADAMMSALFTDAASQAKDLNLTYGTALTPNQISLLKSDIVWMVQTQVAGQTVLVPVVYLSNATQSTISNTSTISAGNLNINGGTVDNLGGNLAAQNNLNIDAAGNINNLSGSISGWNVELSAGGDVVNSTVLQRVGDAQNGYDVSQRYATIQAGNVAVLNAGHDVNVLGASVSAGKDAVLIAQNNVNVQSLALTTNTTASTGNGYHNTQAQMGLSAGVTAGGDVAIQSGQDINLTGASVGAGGTAYLNAQKGNVNVGVLALNNTDTSASTTTGTYTQLDTDKGNASATLGAGIQHTTTTNSTSTTTGAGSNVSGNGVVISTGSGDVNITGSGVSAGNGGLLIDSAHDVNITAFNNTTQTTNSTDQVRAGVELDASADGVFGGLAQSGTNTTTTTTQTTAQVSSLNSGGSIVINGKGNVTNEGTLINSGGDVTLSGENVINTAAQDTYTTTTTQSNWTTKEQEGLTTNGTGASINNVAQGKGDQVTVGNLELQQRVTGSYSNSTDTNSLTQAHGTQITSGGSVTVNAKNDASDEGTQYNAGQNIVVSAENYTNKAAANTTTSSNDSTYGSGTATVGLNSSAEVAVTASADGGHQTSGSSQSTAQVGTMKAGGQVVIGARSGDVTLEGTQIGGAQGVSISAARDININQTNNTTSATSAEQSGGANVSASVSLLGTGGSVGVGANTRIANSNDTTSTAQVASITSGSGSISISAGRDVTSEGANMTAGGNVALSGGRNVNLLAATDKTDNTGSVKAGGANVNVGFGTDAAETSVNGGGSVNFENGQTDYHETTQHGSAISAGGGFSVNAGGNATLQGTQVNAGTANLQTGGNLVVESAQHTVKDNSYDVGGTVDASFSKGGGSGGASSVGTGSSGTGGAKGGNAGGGDAGVNVMLSQQDIATNTNATINTRGGTSVNVGGDMTLKGANVNAQGGVSGQVAGNLTVQSVTDKVNVNQTNVNAYAGMGPVGGTPEGTTTEKTQAGLQTGANVVAQSGAFANVNGQQKNDVTLGTASGISGGSGGINVNVGGNTTLIGANNKAGDFNTAGTTSVQNVQTHTSDSSTQFRVDGTVASALGSNEGKGGNFGLSVNLPSSHDVGSSEPAPTHSSTPSSVGEEPVLLAPHPSPAMEEHPGPASSGVRGPPSAIPPGEGNGANIPHAPPSGTVAPHELSPPENVPDMPNPPHSAPIEPSPPTPPHSTAADTPKATANATAPPREEPAPLLPTVHPEPVVQNEPTPEPAAHNTTPAAPMDAASVAAIEASPAAHDTAPTGPLEPEPSAPAPIEHPPAPTDPVHVAMATTHPSNPSPGDHPDEHSATSESGTALGPDIQKLQDSIAALPPDKRADIEPRLQQILELPENERNGVLETLQQSVAGSYVRDDGLRVFPLQTKYVGENVAALDKWNERESPVKYFSQDKQEFQRLYFVGGELTFLKRPLKSLVESMSTQPDNHGNLVPKVLDFVVTTDGRLIAARPKEDEIHHSSLAAGKPVLMAGEFKFDPQSNDLIEITNQSGHFRPDSDAFAKFLVALKGQGLNLDGVEAHATRIVNVPGGGFKAVRDKRNLLKSPAIATGEPNGMLGAMSKASSRGIQLLIEYGERKDAQAAAAAGGHPDGESESDTGLDEPSTTITPAPRQDHTGAPPDTSWLPRARAPRRSDLPDSMGWSLPAAA
jgi:filamentous hemagglutinin